MKGIFGLDGPFVKYASLLADIFIINLLFILTSIPIFTIGASATSAYYVMTRRIYEKEGYIFKDYFKSFKNNFAQSTILSVALNTVIIILVFNLWSMYIGASYPLNTPLGLALGLIYLFLLIEAIIVSLYLYPLIARFYLGKVETLKTAFLLGNKHMPTTISLFCVFTLTFYLTLANPFFIIISIGVYITISSYFVMKVFKKYRPTMDAYLDELSYDDRSR